MRATKPELSNNPSVVGKCATSESRAWALQEEATDHRELPKGGKRRLMFSLAIAWVRNERPECRSPGGPGQVDNWFFHWR